MKEYICTEIIKTTRGQTRGYGLTSTSGGKVYCLQDTLLEILHSNGIVIKNMTLTKNNRLLVKKFQGKEGPILPEIKVDPVSIEKSAYNFAYRSGKVNGNFTGQTKSSEGAALNYIGKTICIRGAEYDEYVIVDYRNVYDYKDANLFYDLVLTYKAIGISTENFGKVLYIREVIFKN